ncbi:MAG: S41 family peptidase [Lewinellaceae bacterium]|nr:S41 family peptidase [Lewinellaceae bacterium]
MSDNRLSSKQYQVWIPLMLAVTLVVGMLIGTRLRQPLLGLTDEQVEAPPVVGSQGKVEELMRYIEAKYVDEVDRDKLLDEAIETVLRQLDPHSAYISRDELEEVNEDLQGEFEGIGVEFMIFEDTVVVVTPLRGGPSEAAGIRTGDKIIQVGDSTVAGRGVDNQGITKLLRGEKGTEVRVGVLRGGESKLRYFLLTRDKIPVNSIEVAYPVDNRVGYIRINRFSATTDTEFVGALEKLIQEDKIQDLIIDLRHNPGGYLQKATNILSQLFPEKGRLLVYTQGRTSNRSDYLTSGRAFFDVGRIVVLIDEGSASASEILAGAVQDHDRGFIIGRRSFGKGLVQEQYPLRDGSALRLTVARYYTPSGRSIQRPYTDRDSYESDYLDRYKNGELLSENKMPLGDSTDYYTSGGRVVHGGGGIIPDVFVPLDTLEVSDAYMGVRQFLPSFVFRYMDGPQAVSLNEYTLEKFVGKYKVSGELLAAARTYAATEGTVLTDKDWQRVRPLVARFIKARIGRQLFGNAGFYAVWNTEDAVLRAALQTLAKSDTPLSYNRDK